MCKHPLPRAVSDETDCMCGRVDLVSPTSLEDPLEQLSAQAIDGFVPRPEDRDKPRQEKHETHRPRTPSDLFLYGTMSMSLRALESFPNLCHDSTKRQAARGSHSPHWAPAELADIPGSSKHQSHTAWCFLYSCPEPKLARSIQTGAKPEL